MSMMGECVNRQYRSRLETESVQDAGQGLN